RTHSRDHVIRAVGDLVDAHPDAAHNGVLTLPPRQHRLAAIALDTEVRRLVAAAERIEPDRTPSAVHDLWALLSARGGRPPRPHEEEPPRRLRTALKDGDRRWGGRRPAAPRRRLPRAPTLDPEQ